MALSVEPPGDLEQYSFTEQAPWVVDQDAMPWRRAVPGLRRQVAADLPRLVRPGKVPPGMRVVRTTALLGRAVGVWAVGARRKGGGESIADLSRRLRLAAERLGPHLHQARPDPLLGRGHLPAGARRGVQALPGPGAAGAVRRRPRPSSRRTSAGRSRRCSSASTPSRSPPPRSPRCTAPRCSPARRSW